MASAGTVTVDFAAETAKFTAELKKVQASLGNVEKNLSSIDKVGRLAFRFVTAGAIISFAKSAFTAADATGDMAEANDLAVETFSRLQFAASQTDVEISSLTSGISKYQVTLSKATSGQQQAQATLARYNLEADKLSKLSLEDQLGVIADAFNEITNAEDRTRFAVDIFGKAAGPQLKRFLKDGSDGIRELMNESDRLGITLRGPTAEAIDEVDKAIKRMTASAKAAVVGAVGEFALLFSPPTTEEGRLLVQIAKVEGFIRNTKDVLAGGRGLEIFVDVKGETKRLEELNAQLATLQGQLRNVRGETGTSQLMNLLPLPFLDPLQAIDIAEIQALKINVDDLAIAFQHLNQSIAEIQQARASEALQLVNASVVENQRAIEQLVTSDLQVELDNRAAATQAHRAFELQQEQALQQTLQQFRTGTINAAIGALQAFAGQSKKVAIALVLINKARAIVSIIQDTAAASVKALAVLGPVAGPPAAAAIKAYGAAQIALVAASGIGEVAQINRAGGAPIGSPSNPINTQSSLDQDGQGATTQRTVQVVIQGNVIGNQQFIDDLIEDIRDAVDDKDVVLIRPTSRNAKELLGA